MTTNGLIFLGVVAVVVICIFLWMARPDREAELAEKRRRLRAEEEAARQRQLMADVLDAEREKAERAERVEELRKEREERDRAEAYAEAEKNLMRAIDIIINCIPNKLKAAQAALDEANRRFTMRSYIPFWGACFETKELLEAYQGCVNQLLALKSYYYNIAKKYPGLLPPFIVFDDVLFEGYKVSADIAADLDEVTEKAFLDEAFSNAFGHLNTQRAVTQGFARIHSDLILLRQSIEWSTVAVAGEIAGLRGDVREASERASLDQRRMVSAIEQNSRYATGVLSDNMSAQVSKTNGVIKELRSIKRRMK